MKKALLALAAIGLVAGAVALPSQAADQVPDMASPGGQVQIDSPGESSDAMNSGAPAEFPGGAEFSGPPSFVKDLLPQQAVQKVPGWLFG
ncbi:MAG: hypothetical protein ABEJ07_06310 [Candidatus Nanohaloarchaea archaeon]